MDKTKFENQSVSWHQQERCDDSDMGRNMHLSDARLSQVSVQSIGFDATDTEASSTKFVHPKRPHRLAQRRSTRADSNLTATNPGIGVTFMGQQWSDPFFPREPIP